MFRDLGFAQVPEGSDAQALLAYAGAARDPAITWEYLEWLQAISPLPLVVKGILSSEDARQGLDPGARAIVVSNHGGRQLDGAPASVDALPAIASAVGDHAEILLDGGVRRGTDVLKAIALGARAVLVGRPYIWGLASRGASGVRRVLECSAPNSISRSRLTGCRTIAEISPDLLVRREATGRLR